MMRTLASIVAALLLVGGLAAAQGNAKGLLSPSAATNVESTAVRQTSDRAVVSITEGARVPIEPGYSCNAAPFDLDVDYGTVGVNLGYDPREVQKKDKLDYVAFLRPSAKETFDGALLVYEETTVICVESAHPTRKALRFDAFWTNGYALLQIGVGGVSVATAKKYVKEVLEKAQALDYTTIK